MRTLGVRFRPAAITRVFAIDMAQATDREVHLAALVGDDRAEELLAPLRACESGREMAAAAAGWLIDQLGSLRRRDGIADAATRTLLASRGRMPVAELAARLGVSRRRLERSFARHLGIRPKLFARIVRLQSALATIEAAERGRAAEWALDAGYFDEAHLARDFRALAGRRARRSRQRDGELARHFSAPGRLATLLAGE